jgi:Tfp pilus tip-associated adhesin PilY1
MADMNKPHRSSFIRQFILVFAAMLAAMVTAQSAPIDLPDKPLFSTTGAPGNVLLALSVEYPTAGTPAYPITKPYSSTETYIGYFDPAKCYLYTNFTVPEKGYFTPHSLAASHECTSTSSTALWSGNYLNWASTQSLDALRWALTGGDRIVDTTTETIVEKVRSSGQVGPMGYPDQSLLTNTSKATPFAFTMVASRTNQIRDSRTGAVLGTALRFSAGHELSWGCTFTTDDAGTGRVTTFTCDNAGAQADPTHAAASCSTANNAPADGATATCATTFPSPPIPFNCSVTRTGEVYQYRCSAGSSDAFAYVATATYPSSGGISVNPQIPTVRNTPYTGQSSAKRPDNYFVASQGNKLVDSLKKAFAKIYAESDGAITTAFSIPTGKVGTDTASYSTSYDVKTWTSSVTGSAFKFDAQGVPTPVQKWDARDRLDNTSPADRKIVTCCTADGKALPFQSDSLSTAALNTRTKYSSFASVPAVAAASQSAPNYLSYLRGDRTKEAANGGAYRNRAHLLGDIAGSRLAIVGPPNLRYSDLTNAGYGTYKRTYVARKTVIYAGANDGMLHAFDGSMPKGTASCLTCGAELFAYVPSFAYLGSEGVAATSGLASYGAISYIHHFLVDGSPKEFDVDLKNTKDATATAPDWRTLLIGGLGKGGKGYYAIDVSNPDSWTSETAIAGKVLWEFTDTRMGSSFGEPSVVKTEKYGWVVIFTSGYNNSDGKGYFFIVNPRDGSLLEAVETPEGSSASPLNMAHFTAFIPDYTNYTADSVYAGDLLGNIWRLDLTGTPSNYPAPTKITKLTDSSGAGQPVTTRPLVEVDPNSKKRYVLVGTGRLLAESDLGSTQKQAIYAIIDGTGDAGSFYKATTLPGDLAFPITRSVLNANTDVLAGVGSAPPNPMGWYIDLGPAGGGTSERVNIVPDANLGVVAFGVNLPVSAACETGGTGRTLTLSFGNGKTVLVDSNGLPVGDAKSPTGMVTDVTLVNNGGKIRLVVGSSRGPLTSPDLADPPTAAPKRLNWREVPTTN